MSDRLILSLTLKKHWFDLILSGQKTVEYREVKQHWNQRMLRDGLIIKFTSVIFINGYGAHRPFIELPVNNVSIIKSSIHQPHNGEHLTAASYYLISLGRMMRSGNITS
jgi:ASC-1-like (ASCH) protein